MTGNEEVDLQEGLINNSGHTAGNKDRLPVISQRFHLPIAFKETRGGVLSPIVTNLTTGARVEEHQVARRENIVPKIGKNKGTCPREMVSVLYFR